MVVEVSANKGKGIKGFGSHNSADFYSWYFKKYFSSILELIEEPVKF